MKILLVEDDTKISTFLKRGLQEEGYVVDCSYDGEEALYLMEEYTYDVILLDVMIPKYSGIEVCKKIRDKNISTPIIMLSAKSSIEDKVLGLNEGANDYVTKPFSFDELLARIRVQVRLQTTQSNQIIIEDLILDLEKKSVHRGEREIGLTKKEFILLEYLMRNQGKIVTEDMINEALWDMDSQTLSNIISVYMYRLRNKIDKNENTKLMQTIRGMGYKFGI